MTPQWPTMALASPFPAHSATVANARQTLLLGKGENLARYPTEFAREEGSRGCARFSLGSHKRSQTF